MAQPDQPKYSQQDVDDLMASYLEQMASLHGKHIFVACWDEHALERIARRSGVADPMHPGSREELGAVLALAAQPENI